MAWLRGLKTTYYLRSLGATNAEKSTIDDRCSKCSVLNAVDQPIARRHAILSILMIQRVKHVNKSRTYKIITFQ